MAKRIKVTYGDLSFTIFEKYDVWQLSFKDPSNSKKIIKRSTKLASTDENLQEIKTEVIPSLIEFLTGKTPTIENKEFTLDDFSKEYFELHIQRVREHTARRNQGHYNNHIKPYFGDRLLKSLKPLELEKWQNTLLKKSKPLTVQKYRSVLFSIIDEAIKNDLLQNNPLSKVTAPKVSKAFTFDEDNDIDPFSDKEIYKILENCNGYLKHFVLLMYSTGIRPGEIIALKWKDINFDKKQINIYKTVVQGKLGDPKTPSSVRKVDILPSAYKALKLQYELTKDNEFIFINSSSKMFYSHDIINKRFKEALELSNIEIRSLYNLRHSFASQLISNGEDIVWVSRTLGHIDVSITLKHYTKFIKEDEDTRLKKIAKIGANFGANVLVNL